MKERLKKNATGLAGVLAVGALAAGAFAAGMHLGPTTPAGHNLYHPLAAPAPAAPVRLASTSQPTAIAQEPKAAESGAEGDPSEDLTADGPGATFESVYLLLKRHFVDAVPTDTQMAHGAASAMVSSLGDPESRFLEAPEVAELNAESRGQYRGLGAALAVRRVPHAKSEDVPAYTEYRLVVVAPLPGSPAEKAGLRPGDVVTAINGQWVYNDEFVYAQTKALKALQDDPAAFNKRVTTLQKKIDDSVTLADAQTKLEDPAAKTVSLSISRAVVGPPLALTLEKLDTSAPDVVSPVTARSLPGGIGYLKITQFTPDADKSVAAALANFGTDLKGLVVDLRDSPGGLLDSGTAIAARLAPVDALGYVETKGKKVAPIAVTPGAHVTCPVAVLVDGGTANTAELLASALQAQGDKLIGSPTFGDASDVKIITLRDGSGFSMTVGKLMTAAHTEFGGTGLKPDVIAPDVAGGDAPLDRAVGVLSGRVARVPSDRG